MRTRRLLALAAVSTALLGADVASASLAAQLHPIHLRVSGGEDAWHAENDFRLDWDRPPVAAQGFPITAVDFRVRDSGGNVVVAETRLPWDVTQIEHIRVPAMPGAYTADVWLEGPGGERGPQVSGTLRFDDVRPGLAQPLAPTGWIAGNAAAAVAIEHPAAPLPVSGIRGYAISVDRGAGSLPCAAPGHCSVAETDLRGGIEDDTASLGVLPEGLHVVRVLAVSGSGVSSAALGTTVVRVDATRPEVTLAGIPRTWASGPVQLLATARDALSGMTASGPSGPYTAIAVDGAVPRVERGDAGTITVAGEGIHSVAAYARDAAGNAGEESPLLATVSIDESPPAVTFARAQDPADPERIEATVADPLSGPSPVRGSIAVRAAGSRQRWRPLPTLVSSGRLMATWDSDSFPAGTYEFRATGYDAAGNAASTERRANGTKMVLRSPLKALVQILAGFGGQRQSTRSVPYSHGAPYRGRLTLASGPPLGGLPVEIVEVFDAGSDSSRRTTVVETKGDGTFQANLAPGPSRQVEALFGGNRVLTRAGSERARVEVATGVRLRASAASARVGGAPVIFSGQVGDRGATLPAGGLAVELQFRLPRRRWSEFRTVQTDARGRFRYPYAFSDDDSRGVRFQFRAYTSGGDWPYEPAASNAVTVTGR